MRTDIRIDALTSSRRFVRLAPALLLTICAASSHAESNAVRDADGSRISVTSVGGDVDFTMAGNLVQASPNDTVLLPARIVTGHDGSVGLTQAGTKVSVASDTDVEIPSEAVDGNLIARMVQHRGNVFYDVAPRDLGKLRVETPFLVAVIKGTQFNVAVDDNGTTISLFEGSLEIHTPDDSDIIQLNAGEIAIRSLIDDSIRIVGMDDARVEVPAAVPAVAEESAQPGAAASTDSAAVADAPAERANPSPVAAVEVAAPVAAPLDAAIRVDVADIKPSIAVSTVVDHATVELSIAESVVEVGRDVRVDVLERVDPLDNVGDVKLDADVGPSLDTGADLRIDAGLDLGGALDTDGGLDLGGALDTDGGLDLSGALDTDAGLDLGGVVDAGVDLTLDTGAGDLTLDAGALDLDLDSDVGGGEPVVDLQLDIDPGLGVRAPVPSPPR